MSGIKRFILYVKDRFRKNTIENVLWLININPRIFGFSLEKDKVNAFRPFWIIHTTLLIYIYLLGNINYQLYKAETTIELIKSYVNVTLLLFIVNNSWWWVKHRPLLKSVIDKLKISDAMAKSNPALRKKHEKWLFGMKVTALSFLGLNYTQSSIIYLPHRVNVNNDFAMTPCVGLEPVNESPNKEVCLILLFTQEITIYMVCLNFQAVLIVLITHTAAMYEMLSEELLALDAEGVETELIKERLPTIVRRHVLILDVTNGIKSLFSIPIGTNFVSNALCICFFFYLPLEEWLGFIPIVVYCFVVFFLYCFLCQILINSAEKFERSVYACGWEKFDVKEMKLVYVILIQAQRSVEILAADIVPVNIYTFATTCQFMFKFVTVMKF